MSIQQFLFILIGLFAFSLFANPLPVTRTVRSGRSPETLIAHGPILYVANEGSNDISVILANPERGVRTVRVGLGPRLLTMANGLLYVANHRSNTITVIDTRDDCRIVETIVVGEGPSLGVVVGEFLYVTVLHSDSIVVINTRTHRVEQTIEAGRMPQSIAAANGFVFATNLLGELVVIDARTQRIVKTIKIGILEHPPYLNGDFLIFENAQGPGLAVFDTRIFEIVETIPMGQGARVLTAHGDTLYITVRDDRRMHVINWRTPQDRRIIPMDAPAVGATIYDGYLFVRFANRQQINVFNIEGYRPIPFLGIVEKIPLAALATAMELFGPNLCIALECGDVVFVSLLDLHLLGIAAVHNETVIDPLEHGFRAAASYGSL